MNKKSKIIASGILITGAIGVTSFAIIDPYNILSKKNVEAPEKSLNFKEAIIKDKDKNTESDLNLNGIKDGTYFGVSKGYGGDIKVKVTIENSKMKNIEVVSHSETSGYYENGSKIIAAILKENSINVDAISGATLTSNGIKNAVRDALAKAGFDIDRDNKEASLSKTNINNGYLKVKNNTESIDLKEYNLKDGEYIGEAIGFKGNIKVKVIIKGGKLTDIKVINHNEDIGFFNKAKGVIIQILKNQGTAGVDTISGATYSSRGLLNAVNSALNKIDKENNTASSNIKDIVKDILEKNDVKEEENKDSNISSEKHKLKDGEYIGESRGFKGNIKVKIIIKSGTLVNIEIMSHNDDDEFFNNAKKVILRILKNQNTVGVDTVSGATYSSRGIIDAISRALKESMKTNNEAIIEFGIEGQGNLEGKKIFETKVGQIWNETGVVVPKPIPTDGYVFDHWEPELPSNDEVIKENKTYKAVFVKKIDKSKLETLINRKVDLADKTYETRKVYDEKKTAAEAILAKESATQEEVDKALTELEESIKGLKTSPLSPGQVYDVSTKFAYSATSSGGNSINEALQKTEAKLNENGEIDITMAFKLKKGYSFLDQKGKFIIKNGEESKSLKPEIKDGLEIFKFTLPTFDTKYNVDVYIPSENTFGNDAHVLEFFWKTLRPSGTVAPETNPLKPGNDYTVMVEMKTYDNPVFNSMSDQYMEKPSTILVDKDGVAKLTFRMKEKFSNTRIYADKNFKNSLSTQTVDNKEVTFVLPSYDKEGWVWGTSHILAMKMDVKFGLKINWTTLNNTKEKTKMLTKDGIVSGKMGSYDRKYSINVNLLVDNDKETFKDLIVTHKSEFPIDNSYMDMAIKGISEKIIDKPATMETVRNIDAISGATLSSKAIKETILAALKESIEENNKAVIDFAIVGKGNLEGKNVLKSEIGKSWKEQGFVAPKPVPAEGYFFDRWTPELPASDEVINENKTYKAIFVKKADKTELNALIAKKVDTENKLPAFVADYKEKLEFAKAVSAKEKAKQAEVDKAKKSLEVAIYALDINLKSGQAYHISAKFYYVNKQINAINKALQKIEVKLNENGTIDMKMIFKMKNGYSFLNKGIFTLRDGGKSKNLKPEIEGDLETFKFTLSKFDMRYNVTIKLPSGSIFGGMSTTMELLWDTVKPVDNVSTEN